MISKGNSKGICVFLFDLTGIMCKPWLDAGYTCVLIDGQHKGGLYEDPDNPLLFKWGLWITPNSLRSIVDVIPQVDFLFGFPECTDLAVNGARWFKTKRAKDPEFQTKAMAFVYFVRELGEAWGCTWGLENPVSVISTLWRAPDHRFNPWEYGGYLPVDDVHPTYPDYINPRDAYPKKTCIWCSEDFIMPPKLPVQVAQGFSKQHLMLGGKSLKTKNIRSATPRGFAKAVFISNQ